MGTEGWEGRNKLAVMLRGAGGHTVLDQVLPAQESDFPVKAAVMGMLSKGLWDLSVLILQLPVRL